jgi:hypothetical protein
VAVEYALRRLKSAKVVRLVPLEGGPITLNRTARGKVVGILAFSPLSDCLALVQEPAQLSSPIELAPGQVLFYDGDQSVLWKCAEEGFALLMSADSEVGVSIAHHMPT